MVRNLDSGQTTSFSIHQIAERKGYSATTLEQHYNELEKLMLEEFYNFVGRHSSHIWLHWNMRDINYGFPAIAHRFKVLRVLANIVERAADGSLKTNSTWKDIYGGYPAAVIEIIKENPIISGLVGLIGFVSAVVGIIALFIK